MTSRDGPPRSEAARAAGDPSQAPPAGAKPAPAGVPIVATPPIPASSAGADGPARLAVEDLSAWYGTVAGVRAVTLRFEANRVTALIGPSGCGKSSLLRVLNRMNEELGDVTVGGRVLLDGHNVNGKDVDPVELRMRVGMVFQRPNPFPMSISDNVLYGPRTQGIRKRSELDCLVEESLTRAALWNEVKGSLKKHAFELSGGQQQRLCIARALATRPEVLLMDEPASALDPISTQQVEDTIAELKPTVTIVIVTHNMQQAARISDQTAFMLRESMDRPSQLIEVGDTRMLFTTPRDKRTESYITGRFG